MMEIIPAMIDRMAEAWRPANRFQLVRPRYVWSGIFALNNLIDEFQGTISWSSLFTSFTFALQNGSRAIRSAKA